MLWFYPIRGENSTITDVLCQHNSNSKNFTKIPHTWSIRLSRRAWTPAPEGIERQTLVTSEAAPESLPACR